MVCDLDFRNLLKTFLNLNKNNMDKQKIETELNEMSEELDLIQVSKDAMVSSIQKIRTELNSEPIEPAPITFETPVFLKKLLGSADANVLYQGHTPLIPYVKNGVNGWLMKYRWIPTNPTKYGFHLSLFLPPDFTVLNSNVYNQGDVNTGIGGDKNHHYGAYSGNFNGLYYQSWHENPFNGQADRMISTSSNGIDNFGSTVKIGKSGEDSSFCICEINGVKRLRLYYRPFYPGIEPRRVVMIETINGNTWSSPVDVLTPVSVLHQYYSMSVCQVAENMYYATVTKYDTVAEITFIDILTSSDGINFQFKNVIPMPSGINQMYAVVTYDKANKRIIILVEQTEARHNEGISNKPFGLVLYTAKINGI